MKLLINAIIKFIVGLLIVGLLLFVPAGSFNYINGWLFIGLLFIPMFMLGIILFIKAPDLLKKRLDAKEKEATQKGVITLSGLIFIAGFVVAGLDYRFSWSQLPHAVTASASIIMLVSYTLYTEVMRENAYLSRKVEIQQNQKVIDTGLYGVVRHPMYAVTLWMFLSIPFILGSWWSLLCFLPYSAVIVIRIINEEKFLTINLNGYAEYKKKVKYKLIPLIW